MNGSLYSVANHVHDADSAKRLAVRPKKRDPVIRTEAMLRPNRAFIPIRVFSRIWNVERLLFDDHLFAKGVRLKRKGRPNWKWITFLIARHNRTNTRFCYLANQRRRATKYISNEIDQLLPFRQPVNDFLTFPKKSPRMYLAHIIFLLPNPM